MMNPHFQPDEGKPARTINIRTWQDGELQERQDRVAREVPMEIRVAAHQEEAHPVAVTMRTPGHDVELALGFLFTEGVIQSIDQVAEAKRLDDNLGVANVVEIRLAPGIDLDIEQLSRHVYTSSSCGVCGKQTIDRIMAQGLTNPKLNQAPDNRLLAGLPKKLNQVQSVFHETGGLHASALFDPNGNLLVFREDVGRHNALDKLVGRLLCKGRTPASNHILLLSGRTGFELIQKAVFAGIPIVAGIGAPSSLAVTLAQQFEMTLIGFLRENRFNIYT